MAPIVITIDIDRPPADVYAYATDPAHFPDWQRDVASTRMETSGPQHIGSRFTTTRKIGPANQTLTQEITEIDPPRRWAAGGGSGPLRVDAWLTIAPLNDGRASRVTFEIDYRANGVGRAILPLVVRQTRGSAAASFRRLKELLEAR